MIDGMRLNLQLSQQIYNRDCPKHPVSLVGITNSGSAAAYENVEKLIKVARDGCEQLYVSGNESATRRAMASFLAEARQYAPICDVFTQGAPSAVAVCWGTVRVILEVRVTFG